MIGTESASAQREAAAQRLDSQARDAWAEQARAQRWTLWTRLSWAWTVSEATATRQVEAWADELRARVPGSAVLVGLHNDTDRLHAHALIFIPSRWSERRYPPGVCVTREIRDVWHHWRHGLVWAERYSPARADRRHGAAAYLARDVGTVMQFGTAPSYQPRRRR